MAISVPLIAQQKEAFKIEGVGKKDAQKVYLMYYAFEDGKKIVDSAIINNQTFYIDGEIEGPSYAGLVFGNDFETASKNWQDPKNKWFLLFKGETKINFEPAKPEFDGLNEGQALEVEYNELREEKMQLIQGEEAQNDRLKAANLMQELKNMDESILNKLISDAKYMKSNVKLSDDEKVNEKITELRDLNALMEQKYGRRETMDRAVLNEFIAKHNDEKYSLYRLKEYLSSKNNYEEAMESYQLLSADLQNSNVGRNLAQLIESFRLKEGATAPAFAQMSVDGDVINLSDYRGKYVLIDFWASWCVPCRHENPTLVKAYNQYKNQNFEILGISLDEDREPWLKAIEEDKLEWDQVSDLKGWRNEVAVQYGIRAVPASFLIDPEGKIVAKNLRGEALLELLAKVLQN